MFGVPYLCVLVLGAARNVLWRRFRNYRDKLFATFLEGEFGEWDGLGGFFFLFKSANLFIQIQENPGDHPKVWSRKHKYKKETPPRPNKLTIVSLSISSVANPAGAKS